MATTVNPVPAMKNLSSPKPAITLRGVLFASLAWFVYSLIATIPLMSSAHVALGIALLGQLTQSFFLAALSAIPWLVVIRWMDGKRWIWILAAHVILAPVYSVATYLLYVGYLNLVSGSAARSVSTAVQWIIFSNATLYVLQFSIYHGIRISSRLRQKEKEALELAVLARDQELSALKSQINPHFLFNTLNSISAVASRDAEATRTMIAELGDLFRYATHISKRDLVPLQEEVAFTRSYLNLESKRLGDRLRVEYKIDARAMAYRIPPLILQPLVENAIIHGIEPTETPAMISVVIDVVDGFLVIKIEDTGVGLRPSGRSEGSGIGLQNTDRRLRTLFGDRAALHTRTREEGGFEATFAIPLDPKEE